MRCTVHLQSSTNYCMIFCEVDHTTFSSFAAYAQRTLFSSGQCKYDELHLGLASSASFCEVHPPHLSYKNTIQALCIMPVKYMLYGLRTLHKYLVLASSASFCEVHCIDYHALPLSWVDGDHHMDANDEDNKGGGYDDDQGGDRVRRHDICH